MPLYHLLFPHFIQTTNRAPLFRTPSRSPFLRKPYRDIPETTPVRLLFDLALFPYTIDLTGKAGREEGAICYTLGSF